MSMGFMVFDIETVSDGRLIQKVHYPDRPDADPVEIIAEYRKTRLEDTGSDFVPLTFQLPVSVAIVRVENDYRIKWITTIDSPRYRPQVITRKFWDGYRKSGAPTLVTFNGRGFDLPVLELAAFRYGVSLSDWYVEGARSWDDPRGRYNTRSHIDLFDVLGNWGATRLPGGLDLLATLLGKPGKMGTTGYMVQDLYQAGEHRRIDDYCLCDALDTYFVFLRTRVLLGRITVEQEHEIVTDAHEKVTAKAEEIPALREYIDNFRFWKPCGDDDPPFLAE